MKTRVAAIVIEDGKMLMLLGKGYSELWTPGGKVKDGESDEECLRRELMEELGVEPVWSKFFKEYRGRSFYQPCIPFTERVYVTSIRGEIKPDMEIEKAIWYSKDDFLNKRYPMITGTEEKLIPDLVSEGIW